MQSRLRADRNARNADMEIKYGNEKDAEIQRVLDFRIFFFILGKISVSNICMLSQCTETS